MRSFIFCLTIALSFYGCKKDFNASAGPIAGQGGSTARFAISGNYLYTVSENTLTSYSISNAADPVLENKQQIGFGIETIYPFGDKLFIGSTSEVHIFSLEDPARPAKLSTAISPSVLRRCDPVVAKDTVAFATLRTNAECGGFQSILAIYDIKTITNPVQRQSLMLDAPYGLGYADSVLYVCDAPGLKLFNIKNPYQTFFIKALQDGEFFDVIPYGDLLFCWTKTGAIIYNITDPANPQKLSTIQ